MVKILTGMRRVGKSSLLMMLREELHKDGIEEERIVYLNMESLTNVDLLNFKNLYNFIIERARKCKKRIFVMIDEIQNIDKWEKCITSLMVDINCDIYITGSNSSLFSSELATLMTGRYTTIPIYPLSFSEFLKFYKAYRGNYKNYNRVELFWIYVRYGGLPGLFKIENENDFIRQYLTDVFNSVVLKDVVIKNEIRNTDLLERVILFLADNIGSIISARRVIDFLKSQGRKHNIETIYSYLKSLRDALIFHKVKRYDLQGRKFLETLEKYYLNDTGLKFSLLGFQDKAIPGLLENVVYIELLRRGYTVFVGKYKDYEVDFVAEREGKKRYIQVSYTVLSEKTLEREMKSLLTIKDNFRKTILTMDSLEDTINQGIERKNIVNFLLEEDSP